MTNILRIISTAALTLMLVLPALFPSSSFAEPGPTVQWLMNAPVTLFDRGMDRLQTIAKEISEYRPIMAKFPVKNPQIFSEAEYSFDDNEIVIRLSVYAAEWSPTINECKDIRGAVQFLILAGYSDAKNFNEGKAANVFLGAIFSHNGWREKMRDNDLGSKLAQITFIEVDLNGKDSAGVNCIGRIAEKEPAFRTRDPTPIR